MVGRTLLLKVVLQSIPIYQISGMLAPKGTYAKMVYIFQEIPMGWCSVDQEKGTGVMERPR